MNSTRYQSSLVPFLHSSFARIMGAGRKDDFEDYKCTLKAETRQVAKNELREDDVTRSQALKQFREWILKHPSIKYCRTDSVFLLRFLRTKKFSVPLAQEMLERYLTVRQTYSHWFQKLDINDPDMEAIIDSGYFLPLLERDRLGRKVLFSCAGRFDPNKFTSAEMARAHSIVIESLLDDEENQVRGYITVNDESGLTMSHISAWSFTDIRNMVKCIQNNSPMRFKGTHFFNIPGYAVKIIEFALSVLNEKLRSRVWIHRNVEELKEAIDPKILPKEYGGEVPLSDMIASFKKTLKEKNDQLKALDDMYIEISTKDNSCTQTAYNEDLGGIPGSFRKLEVD